MKKPTDAVRTPAKIAAPPARTPQPAAPASAPAKARNGAPAKERVQLEFQVRGSPNVLFELISTPSGFAEWYCNDVNVRGDQYTFLWDGEEEATTLIGRRLGEVVRFRRNEDDDQAAYFEFRVKVDPMTNEVALIVTDHAWPNEVEATRALWSSQVAALLRVLGA
ncbi:MAG: START-like domain-containing protein [Flavobacteriales bacterium]|nr:START-like domain-containing protein [Flavobacteriales bacterium]